MASLPHGPQAVRAVLLVYADDGTCVGYDMDSPYDLRRDSDTVFRDVVGSWPPRREPIGAVHTLTVKTTSLTVIHRDQSFPALPEGVDIR